MLSHISQVQLYETLWTGAPWAPLSMGFSRQEYWSKLPCPPPRDFPHPGIEPTSLMSPALASRLFPTGKPIIKCISASNTETLSLWVKPQWGTTVGKTTMPQCSRVIPLDPQHTKFKNPQVFSSYTYVHKKKKKERKKDVLVVWVFKFNFGYNVHFL